MFYSKLFDDERLSGRKASEKGKIVKAAVKLSRKVHPINVKYRVLLILALVLVPAIAIFYLVNLLAAVGWSSLALTLLNIKFSSQELPLIEPFLAEAIKRADNQL